MVVKKGFHLKIRKQPVNIVILAVLRGNSYAFGCFFRVGQAPPHQADSFCGYLADWDSQQQTARGGFQATIGYGSKDNIIFCKFHNTCRTLKVNTEINTFEYKLGERVQDEEMDKLNIIRHSFHSKVELCFFVSFDNKLLIYNKLQDGFSPEIVLIPIEYFRQIRLEFQNVD
jgi:hypothetical protein